MKNGQDKLLDICGQLLRIDNRPISEICEATNLHHSTIYRLRNGDRSFMRSSTVNKIVHAMHKTITVR